MSKEYGGFNLISSPTRFFHSANSFTDDEKIYMNFYSARGSILEYLRQRKFRKIYVPNYFCHIVTDYLIANGIEIKIYQVDYDLDYDAFLQIESDAIMLLVNYFGLYEAKINSICKNFTGNYLVDNTHSLRSFSNTSPEVFSYRKHLQVPYGANIYISGKNWCTQNEKCFSDIDYSFLYSNSKNEVYEKYKTFDYFTLNNNAYCDIGISKSYVDQVITARMNIFYEMKKLTSAMDHSLEYSTGGLFCRLDVGSEVSSLRRIALLNKIYLPNLWANIPSLSSGLEKEMRNHLILPLDPFASSKGLDNFFTFVKDCL